MAQRLRVQEVAKSRDVNLSQLAALVNARLGRKEPVAIGTIRRYWYSTRDGSSTGEPIALVDLVVLGTIARALEVPIAALMNESELGQFDQARQAA